MEAIDKFTPEERKRITNAIEEAELDTSGEIRVHIENHCKGEVLDRAAFLFKKLKMHQTLLRNGVLIYLALKDHQFAILGDAGINEKVPEGFWDDIKDKMLKHFREENYTQGLEEGIRDAGKQLKEHFPYQKDDINELKNDISFG